MIKWDLFQGCRMVQHMSINIYHVKKIKSKNYMINSIDTCKAFDKIQHPFIVKNCQQRVCKGNEPEYYKGHINRPSAHIILSSEKLKVFPARSGTK